MRYVVSVILLLASVATYYFFIQPFSAEVDLLKIKKETLDSSLSQLRELSQLRDELLLRYNSIAAEDLERMQKAMPKTPSEGLLMLEIQKLATQNGLSLKSIDITESAASASRVGQTVITAEAAKPYSSIQSSLQLAGSYEGFRLFLGDIEKNLRIIDVADITFGSGSSRVDEGSIEAGYQFLVRISSYFQK